MKKLLLLLTIVLLTAGCGSNNEEKVTKDDLEKSMENYALEIFDNEEWMAGGVNPGTYTVTVQDMKDKMGYDVSVFEKAECDLEKTKVEFIVSEQTHNEQTNYEFNYVYDCKE